MSVAVLTGHTPDVLGALPPSSVHVCVTSPPFWGLRSYGTEPQRWPDGWVGELGQEPAIAGYVEHLCWVFQAVARVLRDDGTLWVNLGDSYTSKAAQRRPAGSPWGRNAGAINGAPSRARDARGPTDGLRPGDRCLVPYRVALAMQAAGWCVRSCVQLVKRAPVPEAMNGWRWVTPVDGGEPVLETQRWRPVQATEVLLQFSKGGKYYGDGLAVRVPGDAPGEEGHNARDWLAWRHGNGGVQHSAAFPTFVPEFAIRAGTSDRGVCPRCGAPWARVVGAALGDPCWRPTCRCGAHLPVPAVVLDCFGGSGTTGLVADRLGRDAILVDLNPAYSDLAAERVRGDCPLFADVRRGGEPVPALACDR